MTYVPSRQYLTEKIDDLRAELEAVKKERNSIMGGYNIQAANLELMRKERDELVAALGIVKAKAMETRGLDFNLTSDEWRLVNAALAKVDAGN